MKKVLVVMAIVLPACAGTFFTSASIDTPCFAGTVHGTSFASLSKGCTDAPPGVPDPPIDAGSAVARASYGHLEVNASMHTELSWGSVEALASFGETVTIQHPGVGYLSLLFDVTAEFNEFSGCCATLGVGSNTVVLEPGAYQVLINTAPFTLSDRTALSTRLYARSENRTDPLGILVDANLSGITVYDSLGNEIGGLQVVPEPAAFLLVLASLLCLVTLRLFTAS